MATADGRGMAAPLQFENVSHAYGQITSVQNINLTVERGEFVALIGPSGSGKSTLIKMAAGLEQPTSGYVTINGQRMQNRLGQTAYMPQSDALLPWRTVLENVMLGAEINGNRRRETRNRARDMLAQFGLGGFEAMYPSQLSGGMRQRAAFLRTFMMERPLVLLDEPLGALDAITRAEIQDWLLGVWEHFSYTVVMVTHDVQEAVYMADRVVVLSARPGQIVTVAPVALSRPRDRATPTLYEQAAALTAAITG